MINGTNFDENRKEKGRGTYFHQLQLSIHNQNKKLKLSNQV